MPRLPAALEPAFPHIKRGVRLATRRVGATTRWWAGVHPHERSLPRTATLASADTVARDPEHARLHPGGPVDQVVRPMPLGHPADHWYWATLEKITFPPRFTLELDGGTVVGDYAAHLTHDGVLDFETSPYFGIKGWREHPLFLRTRLPEAQHFDGTLLSLATRGTGRVYYHAVMDLLERYAVFQETMPGVTPDAILVNTETTYVRQLLTLVGLGDVPWIDAGKHSAITAKRLLVPSLPNVDNTAPPTHTRWLREHLTPVATDGRPRRLYISRGSRKNSRRVTNEDALLEILRPLGFTVFDPGSVSVQEQIDHFAAAEIVVSPHGSALTNLVFASPDVRVLELFAPCYLDPGYWTICSNVGVTHYRYLVGEPADTRPPGSPMDFVYQDITVDLATFRQALAELMEDL